jgi:hypothetical protein
MLKAFLKVIWSIYLFLTFLVLGSHSVADNLKYERWFKIVADKFLVSDRGLLKVLINQNILRRSNLCIYIFFKQTPIWENVDGPEVRTAYELFYYWWGWSHTGTNSYPNLSTPKPPLAAAHHQN